MKPTFEIDGLRFHTLEEFFDEVSEILIPGADWGRNLDAFNDILRGPDRSATARLSGIGRAWIMEPDGDGFGFTAEGWARREELLREAEDRIERERSDPPDTSNLSDAAMALLHWIASGERVEFTKANRAMFRELAAARIILLGHSFVGGDESHYRFTYWGWHRRFELLARAKEPA
jgi:Barstar (barnase inhibitor)